ncbi:Zn-dependent alcohol dehydrogenase [Sphingomonas sp. TDK1]|uniref:Zn-dependent alcohol dehydrogenase n=1 Tax=Sphingomonas sp. TDK1 TaxID=453247 RepID=UPI0007D906C6|nr:Zn-dependent alcohol dehydrogenase [Sphingomonas sp. TDK1]OAN66567.1 alcohol dehydrogenase [Sphingomonas sp. TDK1]
MKAAILNANNGRFDIEQVTIDTPKGHEVLVDVKAAGLCHSDLHLAEANYGTPLPAVLGHELAGIVKALGPDVTEFAVGDHVVGSLVQFCGHCFPCLDGRTYQCDHPEETMRPVEDGQRLTRDADGKPVYTGWGTAAFAEMALVHQNQLVKVPKEVPFPQASLLGCSVITGAGAAINTAHVRPGDSVVVIGAGGVGLNAIAGAKLAGAAHIIAIDAQPQKEALARKFGATDFVNARDTDPLEAVRALFPAGVDHAFEIIGLVPTSEQAVAMVRKGGGAYLVGLHRPGVSMAVSGLDLIVRQVDLRGVYMGSSNIKHDIPMYADLYLQGRFNLDDLVSREVNIIEINEAYEDLKHGAVARTVITFF